MSGLRPTAVTLWGAIGARGRLSGLPTGGRTTTTPFHPRTPRRSAGAIDFPGTPLTSDDSALLSMEISF